MSENAEHPASVLESLLGRVRELDEARSAGDIHTNHFLMHFADHVLADISPLVIAILGEFGTGKSELMSALKELPARSCAAPITVEPEAPPHDEAVRGGCRELIGVLDEVATAALISRSSLGTPAASRIRRGTPPAIIAEILRRRDQLQPGASSERPAADDAGTGHFPVSQDDAPTDQDAGTAATLGNPDSMTCADARDQVYNYLDGEIRDEDNAKVRQHLEKCVPCLREYGLDKAVSRIVQKHCGCDPAPAELRAKVLARIRMIAGQPMP